MKKKGFTLVELLVVIAIIALLMGILMPALARVRQIAFRMVCGTNLSGIGKAMLIYANDYQDSFPRAGGRNSSYGPVQFDAPTRLAAYHITNSDGSGGTATITASFYLLVKYAEVTPKSFICKGDTGVSEFEPGNNIDMTLLWDFGSSSEAPTHCSYSMNQPYCMNALSTTSDPGMVIAADPNPWFGDRDPSVFSGTGLGTFQLTGGKEYTKMGNTINHQDEGQNVLFIDSHVNFESVSFCGVNEDNIYTMATSADVRKGSRPTASNQAPYTRLDNLLVTDSSSSGGKGSRGACFLGDTQVCVNGTFMPISQVAAGQTIDSASVEKLEEHVGSFDCRDIELTNGNKISVVALHYFMLDSGIWVRSIDLRSGMTLRTQNGNIAIKSVTTREQPYVGKVYNVKVKNSEQYLVGQDSVVVRDW